ncbi:MAG TPA: GNAT family N-acetyltransferase [Dehalococcoidia bacterium]|nr:GNAT family N-acetyltransferase [Dehalococcoidia bacterium]
MFASDDVIARGRRTVVRRKRLSDAADEYRWRRDPELARYDASRPLQSSFEDYQRNWWFDYRFTDVAGRSFAIEDENGRHVGNVMYYNLELQRGEAEIGISIGERRCWSQGYGSDALAALARVLFATTGLRRLYLNTLAWNERAQRAFQKAGFAPCGTSWRDGHTFVVMQALPGGVEEAVATPQAVA